MPRISPVLTLASSFAAGFAVFTAVPASPASAATTEPAATTEAAAAISVNPASAAASSTAIINVNAPSSTYAKVTFSPARGGVQISTISITGLMTAKGCYSGSLYRNGTHVRQSNKVCAGKGKRVTVTWTRIGYASIGTGFRTTFSGSGAPAGLEAFKIS